MRTMSLFILRSLDTQADSDLAIMNIAGVNRTVQASPQQVDFDSPRHKPRSGRVGSDGNWFLQCWPSWLFYQEHNGTDSCCLLARTGLLTRTRQSHLNAVFVCIFVIDKVIENFFWIGIDGLNEMPRFHGLICLITWSPVVYWWGAAFLGELKPWCWELRKIPATPVFYSCSQGSLPPRLCSAPTDTNPLEL